MHLPASRSHMRTVGEILQQEQSLGWPHMQSKQCQLRIGAWKGLAQQDLPTWRTEEAVLAKDCGKSRASVNVGMRCPTRTGFVGKEGRYFVEKESRQTGITQGFLLSSALLPGSVHLQPEILPRGIPSSADVSTLGRAEVRVAAFHQNRDVYSWSSSEIETILL